MRETSINNNKVSDCELWGKKTKTREKRVKTCLNFDEKAIDCQISIG